MSARLSPEERLLRAVTEKTLQGQVEGLAALLGWTYFHPADNRPVTTKRGSTYVQNIRAGFPDLVLVKDRRLLVAELKKQDGRISPDQRSWLDTLALTGRCEVYLWRPSDLPEVRDILTGRISADSRTRWRTEAAA